MINPAVVICLYGPESTGKTTLAQQLARRFQTCWVPEVARERISSNRFSLHDIEQIAVAQAERTGQLIAKANRVLFCDTDLITTQIYSQFYLGQVPDVVLELQKKLRYDHYFLFDVDVPWVPDGLRDLEHLREAMLAIFETELKNRALPYTWVRGTWTERQHTIEKELLERFGIAPVS